MKVNGTRPLFGGGKPSAAAGPDPDVGEGARRRFTVAYKLSVVEKSDACETPEIGELRRREGLNSSHLSSWRKAAREGSLRALAKKRGPRPSDGKRPEEGAEAGAGERAAARGTPQGAHHHRCPGKSSGLLGVSPRREALLSAPEAWPGTWAYARRAKPSGSRAHVLPSPEVTGSGSPGRRPGPGRDGAGGLPRAVLAAFRGPRSPEV